MGTKDYWNSQPPAEDGQFASHVANPELAGLLPVLYPGVFPNLAAYNKTGAPRADLLAILLTGIPTGVVPGFQNYTGSRQADVLRLNVAIPSTTTNPSNLGLVGGDPAGYPERPPGLRRRGHHRATRHRRCNPPAGRHELHGRRRRRGHLHGPHLGPDRSLGHGNGELPAQLPVPGHAVLRVPRPLTGELTGGRANRRRRGAPGHRVARAPSSWTSAGHGARWSSSPPSGCPGRRSRSGWPTVRGTGPTPPYANATFATPWPLPGCSDRSRPGATRCGSKEAVPIGPSPAPPWTWR